MSNLKKVAEEINNAKKFRAEKNEGKSRVCARRAVGFAIQLYFMQKNLRIVDQNALNLIRLLKTENNLPEEIVIALNELVLRVTPEFDLPGKVDLISSATIVVKHLFPSAELSMEEL